MSDYEYPDVDDRLTRELIDRKEPYPGYWEASENRVLSHAERFLNPEKKGRLLDIGCGDGRLLGKFDTYFGEIIGLEPDRDRLNKAKEGAGDLEASLELVNKTFLEADFEDTFDAVLCSHVLQHIQTSSIESFEAKIEDVLEQNGILILTTSHSGRKEDMFLKGYMEEGEFSEDKISEEEFNSLVTNDENVLPVHLFTIRNLRELLDGFRIKSVRVFHELHSRTFLDRMVFRDRWINIPGIRKRMGRDVMVVAEKK